MSSKSETSELLDPIPLCEPQIQGNEWKYIKESLDTNWVSSAGPFVSRFENMLADLVGIRHGVATASGTAALHIALLVAGVEPDDEVLVPTLTFIAPVNAIKYIGAIPVLIDAEPNYWQIDTEKVAQFLRQECLWKDGVLRNKVSGRRVKAILPVHILGHPADMDPIMEMAEAYNLLVIEDAAESLGSKYKERKVGMIGDLACFSFNGNKIVTSGSGGMIVTDNKHFAERAKYLTLQAKDDPHEYIHNEVGYNYRLTNVHAALGCAQIERLDEFVLAKRQTGFKYRKALADIRGITVMAEAPWAESTYWLNTILIDGAEFGLSSREVIKELGHRDIQARPLWQPLHRSLAHSDCRAYETGVADTLYEKAVSLPSSVGLTSEDLDRVTSVIQSLRPSNR